MMDKLTSPEMAKAAGEAMMNAAQSAIGSRAGDILQDLERDTAENDGIGEVDVTVKFKAYAPGDGTVELIGLGIKWSRKVSREDKDFDPVKIDPRQLILPGMEVAK
jgi:hypothetical protein